MFPDPPGFVHTPALHVRSGAPSDCRVHGAFSPPEGASTPPHPGSRMTPRQTESANAPRTTEVVYQSSAFDQTSGFFSMTGAISQRRRALERPHRPGFRT